MWKSYTHFSNQARIFWRAENACYFAFSPSKLVIQCVRHRDILPCFLFHVLMTLLTQFLHCTHSSNSSLDFCAAPASAVSSLAAVRIPGRYKPRCTRTTSIHPSTKGMKEMIVVQLHTQYIAKSARRAIICVFGIEARQRILRTHSNVRRRGICECVCVPASSLVSL